MNTVTFMTRHKSYKDMLEHLSERHKQVLDVLKDKEMTTREIAKALYEKGYTVDSDVNNARPRVTELEQLGFITTESTKKCSVTKKEVAIYRKTTELEKMQLENINHIPNIL